MPLIIQKSEGTRMPQRHNHNHQNQPARPMPIDLSKTDIDDTSEPMTTDDAQSKDGIIIIQNNQFFITSPLSGGKPAVVSPIPPVVLKKNLELITSPTEVLSSDRLEWEVEEQPPYGITVSEDKLSAFFTLHRVEQYAWRLKNCPATNNIAVCAEPDKELLLSTLRIEQVIADFDKRSISHNLDIPAIYKELNQPTGRPVRVAEGKAPTPGTAARLEMLFSLEVAAEHIFWEWDDIEDDKHPGLPGVPKGDIIARKHPFIKGVPGTDVYGSVLPAAPPEDIQVVAKEHAGLLAGGEIIALRAGRPRLTGNQVKSFDIPSGHTVLGNVNSDTGNIVFSGDVAVHGNVGDNMIIEALGNVYIYGSVNNATITATGSIFVRGAVVNSRLYSGHYGVIHNRLYHRSKKIMEEGNLLRQAAKVLSKKIESRKQPVKYGQVIQLLLDTKFKQFSILIPGLLNVLSDIKHSYQQDTKQLKRLLEVFLTTDQFIDLLNDAVVESFLKLLRDMYGAIAGLQESKVRVDFLDSHSSNIQSSGDIHMNGESVQDSSLLSGGDITFTSSDAVCEGSIVEAEGIITAQTVGGSSDIPSTLKAGKRLIVRKMNAGTITVGDFSEEIAEPIENAVITPQTLQRRVK
jgi:hypothetical protein